jgi:hypothetical protein
MGDIPENADEPLTRAKLVLESYSVPPRISPLDAWERIIGAELVPAAVVADDVPGYLGKVEKEWREIASREQILNGDDPFWIHGGEWISSAGMAEGQSARSHRNGR